MYKIAICGIAVIIVYLLIMQCAANAALCFSDEEIRQIKAAINQYKSAITRFIIHFFSTKKGKGD